MEITLQVCITCLNLLDELCRCDKGVQQEEDDQQEEDPDADEDGLSGVEEAQDAAMKAVENAKSTAKEAVRAAKSANKKAVDGANAVLKLARKKVREAKVAKKRSDNGGVPGVTNVKGRDYYAGVVLKEIGLKTGITDEVIAQIDKLYGKKNPKATKLAAVKAWHALDGYLSKE